jgi:hypothetical protein
VALAQAFRAKGERVLLTRIQVRRVALRGQLVQPRHRRVRRRRRRRSVQRKRDTQHLGGRRRARDGRDHTEPRFVITSLGQHQVFESGAPARLVKH